MRHARERDRTGAEAEAKADATPERHFYFVLVPNFTMIAFATAIEPLRIAKAMARAGLCSRREAERWIEQGRVNVNGKVIVANKYMGTVYRASAHTGCRCFPACPTAGILTPA